MAEIQMDKVKSILAHMDDSFWQTLIERNNLLQCKAETLTAAFMESLTKLSVAQFNIVETKYNGYQQLAENKKKTAAAGIVRENKASIDTLTEQKRQYTAALTGLLVDFAAVIEEVQDLGTKQGGGNH